MTDLLLAQSPTVQSVPGATILTANPVTSPDDFSDAAWLGSGNPAETPDVEPGPFGADLGTFQKLEIDLGTSAAWTQVATPFIQSQCFSVFVKLSGDAPRAEAFEVQILSVAPFVQNTSKFAMSAGGIVTFIEALPAGEATGGVEDLGGGLYRCYVALDVDDSALISVGVLRRLTVNLGFGGSAGWNLLAYGARLDDGFETPQGHVLQLVDEVTTSEELDLVIEDGDLKLDLTLQTPVLVSLFSDARAQEGDAPELGELERRGFWADNSSDRFGSRLWLMTRRKIVPRTLLEAETWTEEGLSWLIRDGIAEEIDVTATNGGGGLILLELSIIRGTALEHAEVWDALSDIAIDSPGVRLRLVFS